MMAVRTSLPGHVLWTQSSSVSSTLLLKNVPGPPSAYQITYSLWLAFQVLDRLAPERCSSIISHLVPGNNLLCLPVRAPTLGIYIDTDIWI